MVNTAIQPDGSTDSVTGTAVPVEGSNNAKLKVTINNFFAKLLGSPPEYGNYWILKLEPDYSVALLGSPDRDTLGSLAREPQVPDALFEAYIQLAKKAGYDTDQRIVNNAALDPERRR